MAEEVQLEDLNSIKQDNNAALDSNVSQDTKINTQVENQEEVRIRKPRRVLHFSDGTLEEYSTDEEDNTDSKKETSVLPKINPVQLTWGPWMWYWTLYSGSSALAACDYVGEGMANFLGITSPKYQYEIEEFNRMQEEEEKEKKEQEEQMAGWTSGDAGQAEKGGIVSGESDSQLATTKQPSLNENSAEKYTVEEEKCPKTIEITTENIDPELPIDKLNLSESEKENTTTANAFMKMDSDNQHSESPQIDTNSTEWKRF